MGRTIYEDDLGVIIQGLKDKIDRLETFTRNVQPSLVTSLPANPYDGQEVYFLADATNGAVWHLRYRASATGSYKWDMLGGPSIGGSSGIGAQSLSTVGAFADFPDGQPTIALPLKGDYFVEWGAEVNHTGTNQGIFLQPVATGLAAGTSPAYMFSGQAGTTNNAVYSVFSKYRATGISGTLKIQYFVGATGGTADRRRIYATPIRVG